MSNTDKAKQFLERAYYQDCFNKRTWRSTNDAKRRLRAFRKKNRDDFEIALKAIELAMEPEAKELKRFITWVVDQVYYDDNKGYWTEQITDELMHKYLQIPPKQDKP